MLKFFKNPKILFPLFMSFFMALIMSFVMVVVNVGFVENFFLIWMKSFVIGFSCAFPTVFFVAPKVNKLVNIVVNIK